MSDLETFNYLFPQFTELNGAIHFNRYDSGAFITHESGSINQLYFFLEGSAWVYQNQANGRAHLFQVYSPGWIIGDIEFFLNCPASCSVKTTSVVRVGVITHDALRLACLKKSTLVNVLATGLAEKLRSNSFDAARNMSFPLINRLAFYLKAMNYSAVPRGKSEEIADLLGTTKRHLRRVISQLEEQGIVERRSQALVVLNSQRIELLCNVIDP
ncbi:MAG: Crp/Fnr family transcriptional regulator [Bacteroidetes bacterium]|nr:Crp/Fnr family transcriptional regulator [Bacteroidota bacterium]